MTAKIEKIMNGNDKKCFFAGWQPVHNSLMGTVCQRVFIKLEDFFDEKASKFK